MTFVRTNSVCAALSFLFRPCSSYVWVLNCSAVYAITIVVETVVTIFDSLMIYYSENSIIHHNWDSQFYGGLMRFKVCEVRAENISECIIIILP